MTGLWVSQASAVPSPTDVAAYLRQNGWALQKADTDWSFFEKELLGEQVVLEVPQRASTTSYSRLLGTLLDDLSRLEGRAPAVVLRDVRSSTIDVVRIGIESSLTRDGRIPLEAGHQVYDATRDLFLAAACSALDPRPAFSNRKPEEALKLLSSSARLGQTEFGSFIVTLECSVPPLLQSDLLDGAPADEPLVRRATTMLARGLAATQTAARLAAIDGSLKHFSERAPEGLSANLCEAVAQLLEVTLAERLVAGVSFAPTRQVTPTLPRATVFSPDIVPTLRSAAASLREVASYPDVEFFGRVVKLDSTNPTEGGTVTLRGEVEGRQRSVRVTLSSGDYKTAVEAHKNSRLIAAQGALHREASAWVLKQQRRFEVAEDAEVT